MADIKYLKIVLGVTGNTAELDCGHKVCWSAEQLDWWESHPMVESAFCPICEQKEILRAEVKALLQKYPQYDGMHDSPDWKLVVAKKRISMTAGDIEKGTYMLARADGTIEYMKGKRDKRVWVIEPQVTVVRIVPERTILNSHFERTAYHGALTASNAQKFLEWLE